MIKDDPELDVVIEIVVKIPVKDFSYETRDTFIKAVVALFKGMFPNAKESSMGSPFTVSVGAMDGSINENEEL